MGGKKTGEGRKEKRLSTRLSISANFPPGRIMVRLRFHLVSASCTGRVPTNIDKFTGVPHKCARPPRTARINFEELNARAKTHATRAKIQIFPQILVDPSRFVYSSGMGKESSPYACFIRKHTDASIFRSQRSTLHFDSRLFEIVNRD